MMEHQKLARFVIPQKQLTEQALLDYLEVIRIVFSASPDMMWVTYQGRFLWCNQMAANQLGYGSTEELIGLSPSDISPKYQPNQQTSTNLAKKMIDSAIKYGYHRFEWVHQAKTGELVQSEVTLNAVPIENENDVALFAVGRDISLEKQVEDKLRLSEYTDTLTGLPNRAALVQRIGQQMAIDTQQLSLVCIGADGFRALNEEYGLRIGDKVLVRIAEIIADSLPSDGYLGRFTGDTFLVVIPNQRADLIEAWAKEIIIRLNQRLYVDGVDVLTCASAGLSHMTAQLHSTRALLHQAEVAMKQAKRLGRCKVHCYSAEMAAQMAKEQGLAHQLKQAINNQEFFLVYQPIFHLQSGMITGAEALIRWRHPERGVLTPADFIPQAEARGLIVDIGNQVIDMACAQVRSWIDQGLPLQHTSINISVKQIENGDLVEVIQAALERHHVPAESLEIEVTETMLLQHGKSMVAQLWQLRQLGIAIAIDDFGTGYSSFARLKNLPVDRVKIDRSFISELERDERNSSIVQAIVSLAHNLDMVVTAEGIESHYQYQYMKSQGCEAGQGYLVSPPVPAVKFEYLVKQRWQQREHDLELEPTELR
ncbi:EAL domain-containing protein [Ferrimonas aestuarii]|uniref:cyclic-guanylate-specific phosphodiesterase n=2 Tax=Ferrimonas aestuarii TaxID=2569539 RepID=A0A4U1BR83_9GAMM|nr:EAL domain-containing protein [Ferrimonas aestuarii]